MQIVYLTLATLVVSTFTTACSFAPAKDEIPVATVPTVTSEPASIPPLSPPAENHPPATSETIHVETIVDYQVICTLNDDSRRIENINTLEGGCQLDYEKFGNVKTVATARKGAEFCQSVLERIQSNLEKAGYSCED